MIDFIRELETYASQYDPQIKTDGCVWIKCPFHGGGHERTASCRINLQKGKYPIGYWYCYGCGKHGLWNDLAQAISGLSLMTEREVKDQKLLMTKLTPQQRAALYEEKECEDINFSSMIDWPIKDIWRGINGKLIHDIGGKLYYNKQTKLNQLFLPCYQNKELKGGIRCVLHREQGQKGYFNTAGPWVKKALFPYDYVKSIYKERGGFIALVEGPRDALNMLQYGFPALAILGSHNWSQFKTDLVLLLNPSKIIFAFDNDEAGNLALEQISPYFKGYQDVLQLQFKEGQDPGALTGEEVEKYYRKIKKLVS